MNSRYIGDGVVLILFDTILQQIRHKSQLKDTHDSQIFGSLTVIIGIMYYNWWAIILFYFIFFKDKQPRFKRLTFQTIFLQHPVKSTLKNTAGRTILSIFYTYAN